MNQGIKLIQKINWKKNIQQSFSSFSLKINRLQHLWSLMALYFLLKHLLCLLPAPCLNQPFLLQFTNLMCQQVMVYLRHGHAWKSWFCTSLVQRKQNLRQMLNLSQVQWACVPFLSSHVLPSLLFDWCLFLVDTFLYDAFAFDQLFADSDWWFADWRLEAFERARD